MTILVVGIGADGLDGLSDRARKILSEADVVLGGERHLAMLPASTAQIREVWPSPMREALPGFMARFAGQAVVALASGDPLVSGIGTTLIDILGAEDVEIVPAVSSVSLARARMGWAAESTEVISLVGRDPHRVYRSLAPGARLMILSSDGQTPRDIATLLTDAGYGPSTMTVLGDLGSRDERRVSGVAESWSNTNLPALNVLAVELTSSRVPEVGLCAGLPDSVFEHDGQLTKRDVRASALARLAPLPGQLLWDVGAGAGSIGIEWMRAHPTCQAIAIEAKPERADRIQRNAAQLGVPGLRVVVGDAPAVLHGLNRPDAIFVGGGATADGVLDHCWHSVKPGGRLVVHGVTLETEALLGELRAERGGELTRIHIDHAEPIGRFTGWTAARAVTQWAIVKAPGDAS